MINIALTYDGGRREFVAATEEYGGAECRAGCPLELVEAFVEAVRDRIYDRRRSGAPDGEFERAFLDEFAEDDIRYARACALLRRALETHYPRYAALPDDDFAKVNPRAAVPGLCADGISPDAPEDMRWVFEIESAPDGPEKLAADLLKNGRGGDIWSRYLRWNLRDRLDAGTLGDDAVEIFELRGTEYDVKGRDRNIAHSKRPLTAARDRGTMAPTRIEA